MKNNNLYFNSDSLNQSTSSEDFERACKTLEFEKVLSILASFAATEGAKEKIMTLRPSVSIEKIRDRQKEVSEAKFYIETKGKKRCDALHERTARDCRRVNLRHGS